MELFEVEDGVTRDLTRAVVRDIPPAVDTIEVDAALTEHLGRDEQIRLLPMLAERHDGVVLAKKQPIGTPPAALLQGDKPVKSCRLYGQRLDVIDALEVYVNEWLVHISFRFIEVVRLIFRHDLLGQWLRR